MRSLLGSALANALLVLLVAGCRPSAPPEEARAKAEVKAPAPPAPAVTRETPPLSAPKETSPAETAPHPEDAEPAATARPVPAPPRVPPASVIAPRPVATVPVSSDDPLHGVFSLADATRGLPGSGALVAELETSLGTIACTLLEGAAPRNVANFVGLARGVRPFRDPKTGTWEKRLAYEGTTFHRVVRGFMIQGGDPTGTGRGEAGYVVPDEIWGGGAHDRAGLLCTANRGPNTNGLQFFITDAAAAHLDGGFTIFGVCASVEVVHAIAAVPVRRETPVTPVEIRHVTVKRAR